MAKAPIATLAYDSAPYRNQPERRETQPLVQARPGLHRRCRFGVGAGRALPLLMVCETALGRRNLRAAAGALPVLTTTLELALTGPVTGPVTVWGRNGIPAALHCR